MARPERPVEADGLTHIHEWGEWRELDDLDARAVMEEQMPPLTSEAVVMEATCACGMAKRRWGYGPDRGTTIRCEVHRY